VRRLLDGSALEYLMSAHRRLPAYGRQVVALREQGLVPTRCVIIDRSFQKTAAHPWRLVVPSTEDPTQFDLRLLAGLSPMLVCSSSDVDNHVLVRELRAAGCARGAVIQDGKFREWI
jgi:hypothetical protein